MQELVDSIFQNKKEISKSMSWIVGVILLLFLVYCLWDVAFKNVSFFVILRCLAVGSVLTLIALQLLEPDNPPNIYLIIIMALVMSIAVFFICKTSGKKK